MLLRGLLAVAVLTAGVLLSASFVLETPGRTVPVTSNGAPGSDKTGGNKTGALAMAPLSLGDPLAATALRTLSPDMATGGTETPARDSNLRQNPSFRRILSAARGDTLSGLLVKAGVTRRDAAAAITALRPYFDPGRLRQGQAITVKFEANRSSLSDRDPVLSGRFVGLSLLPDPANRITVSRGQGSGFEAAIRKRNLTRRLARAANVIKTSLSRAGAEAGVPNAVMAEIIRLYSWDVDFQRDIRKGDSFEVMYERFLTAAGKPARYGKVIYASLTLSGRRHAIYRYRSKDGEIGYFDEKGQSARKALMRTPINGARLSSGFGKRKHPILGFTKMHNGLDFAAPRGTPIYAAGNGTVEYAGRKGSYGIYVRIRHNSQYSTAYAHMKALNTRKGRRVKQGQVIGYVGSTGRSTGPHLHYEIIRDNVPVNPLRVKMPSGRKLKGRELTAFQQARTAIDRQYAQAEPKLKLASRN